MVFLPPLLIGKSRHNGGVTAAIMIFSTVIALLCRNGMLYGINNGVLCGLMAGISAILLMESPGDAVFAACAIPVAADIVEAYLELSSIGYASLHIGYDTITAQLIAFPIAAVVIWINGLTNNTLQPE